MESKGICYVVQRNHQYARKFMPIPTPKIWNSMKVTMKYKYASLNNIIFVLPSIYITRDDNVLMRISGQELTHTHIRDLIQSTRHTHNVQARN